MMVEKKQVVFLVPFVTFVVYQIVKINGVNVDIFIRQEGILDSLQFPIYLVTALLVFSLFKKFEGKLKILVVIIGIGILFVAFEEISWGQILFDFQTNDFFAYNNIQNEYNIHNLKIMQSYTHLGYIIIGFIFSTKFIFDKILITKPNFLLFIPGFKYIGYNLPLALYYFIFFYTPFQSKIINYVGQEYFEFMFSVGLLVFVFEFRSLILNNKISF